MAKILSAKCKLCRRLGDKLFLKGERCFSVKCAMTKRNYPPGVHGPQYRARLTDYGVHLKEKQKLKRMYGVLEAQMRKYFSEAVKAKANTGLRLIEMLERRLDNVVYRLGLATSRAQARQFVSHNLFLINNKNVNIPAYQLKSGDTVAIRKEKSKAKGLLAENFGQAVKKEIPSWLAFNEQEHKFQVLSLPTDKDLDIGIDIRKVVEYYSK